MKAEHRLHSVWTEKGGCGGWQTPLALTRAPHPVLTHMAMSLASPGVRASSGPTSFTAEKWSWSWGQESAMWGSWYTSWRRGGREDQEDGV